MRKKLLIFLIFLIVLIVLFLIRILFIDMRLEKTINNTINKINDNDYKIALTLKNEGLVSQKIKYEELKHINTYQFINKIYTNDTLEKTNTSYYDNNTYYYKVNNSFKTKEVKDINEIKDFKIDLNKIFNMKTFKRSYKHNNKTYYIVNMKSKDIFSLIYGNSNNKDNSVKVTLVCDDYKLEKISFKDEDIKVNLKIEFTLQEISLPNN